ncbi:MAG: hypothetical protein FD161_3477 [Limisphaerales bacterium]|nr:MAG: hypothetical protein FD161_3477 [Limisphaerales bacterium]KAG0507695.1 MAG: hypothetical protein E1N63_3143 [Limisphaerales bacterium]TXT52433.1 MAG: hypothetical protein FD140_657 [Limisphaerales bacterium]
MEPDPTSTQSDGSAPAASPPAGPASQRKDPAYPDDLRTREEDLLHARRTAAGIAAGEGHLGLALSGGGIRSATFCLGVLQSFARARLLRRVDYLSTVSGGGYIGGFLGALCARKPLKEDKQKDKVPPPGGIQGAEDRLANMDSAEIRWLRENGRHLAPNGTGDVFTAVAVQMRNWAAVFTVMALSALAVFAGANFLRAWVGTECPLLRHFLAGLGGSPGVGGFWWPSPWLWAALPPALMTVLFGTTYWLVPSRRMLDHVDRPVWVFACVAACCAGLLVWAGFGLSPVPAAAPPLAGGVLLGLGAMGLIWLAARHRALNQLAVADQPLPGSAAEAASQVNGWLRNFLSVRMKVWLGCTLALVVFGVLDSLGQSAYAALKREHLFAFGGGSACVAAVLSLGDKLLPLLGRKPSANGGLPLKVLAGGAGVLGFGLFLLNVNLLGHAILWGGASPGAQLPEWHSSLALLLCAALVSWVGGHQIGFLNHSSLQAIYGARLVRAYLGASNPRRQQGTPEAARVTTTVRGDDLWLADYEPHCHGGPLHLINVTFNETCSGVSNLEQRDRRGLPLTIGPAGVSVGVRHHATWPEGGPQAQACCERGRKLHPITEAGAAAGAFQMFPPLSREAREVQHLTVGHWLAISGAAFSTGMGVNTSLGTSLLTGLANIRLGYWWDSGVSPAERKLGSERWREWFQAQDGGDLISRHFPMQAHLLNEWLARFHGPARRLWYLSDGGHFENTAVYELLRRRLPHIICCDCGADPNYDFTDLANLVRKARIDFAAEIKFVAADQLQAVFRAGWPWPKPPRPLGETAEGGKRGRAGDSAPDGFRPLIGTEHDFTTGKADGTQPHALLAAVRFAEDDHALILFLKPAFSGDEPLDVWAYDVQRKDFPQESTLDQFFDEAQWESYRKLGEHTADQVLVPRAGQPLWFTRLDPKTVWEQLP